MLSDEHSFVIEDSEDEEYEASPARGRQNKRKRSEIVQVIADSDEEIDMSNDNNEEDEDEDIESGRLTPAIHKAIRRSILNISRQLSGSDDDEEESDEDDEESHELSHNFEVSDSEEETHEPRRRNIGKIIDGLDDSEESFRQPQKKRTNRIIDSTSDSDFAEETPKNKAKPRKSLNKSLNDSRNNNKWNKSLISDKFSDPMEETGTDFEESVEMPFNETGLRNFDDILEDSSEDDQEEVNKSQPTTKISAERRRTPRKSPKLQTPLLPEESINISDSPVDESSDEVQEVPLNNRNEVISLDSDTPSEVSNSDTTAMFLAREELGLNKVDPLLAQKRAMLVIEKQNVEHELHKINLFLEKGDVHFLPDNGKKLRESKRANEEKLIELRKQLLECRLVEPDSPNMSRESLSPINSPLKLPKDPEWRPHEAPHFDENPLRQKNPFPSFNEKQLGEKALETLHREQALTLETLKTFHGSLESRPTDDAQAEDPRGLKVKLMPHQKHALAWLLWREHQKPPGGVLADDMGLGKTLTMISLVLKSNEREDSADESDDEWKNTKNRTSKVLGGTLVVCPASLLGQWEEEVRRRCRNGLLNVEVYHGNKRESVPKRLARNDMVITTYNLISREHKVNGVIFKIQWKRIILDEGHVIRNHKSQISESVCDLSGFKRWVLTGTPIHNKEMDLFAVLKFIQCSPFNDIRVWKRWVDNKNQAGLDRLATVMKTLMLRRTKQELMNSGAVETLPEKFLELTWVDLDPEERLVYDKVMLHSKTIFAQFLNQRAAKEQMFKLGAGSYVANSKNPFTKAQQKLLAHHADDVQASQILILLLRLRQICCHPTLINAMLDRDDIEQAGVDGMDTENVLAGKMNQMNLHKSYNDSIDDEDDGPALVSKRVTENLLTSDNPVFDRTRISSKLQAVLDLIDKIYHTSDKVIIVSQWTGVLGIIAENLKKHRREYLELTGLVQVKDRGKIIDSFNHDKTPKILLLSLTAGGVGLNLVGANHLILVDIHWNPQLESQAQDRIYRFGQKKNVFVYKFLCKDTIEERIKDLQDKKLELANNVLSGTGKITGAKLTLDDMKSLFGF